MDRGKSACASRDEDGGACEPSEARTTSARCSTHWCCPDAGGCVRPVPRVVAPVPETVAVAPRRMRMRKFTARSVAWWWRWGITGRG
eukprot:scaffold69365_cov39-Phaeocystis_antarctica.AAC.1